MLLLPTGWYTNGWIYLPSGAQGLFLLAVGSLGNNDPNNPIEGILQIKFNGGNLQSGTCFVNMGWDNTIVASAWVGNVGAGLYGFEAYTDSNDGSVTRHSWVSVECFALMR